jgi:hypothetical protein
LQARPESLSCGAIRTRGRQEEIVNSKLHIDIEKGIIDVEGNEELAKAIYADFREQLLQKAGRRSTENVEKIEREVNVKRSTKTRSREKANGGEDRKLRSADYIPALVTDLDLGTLPEFYGKFETKNNPEKILVFLKFLQKQGHTTPYGANQVYSCYKRVKERPPKVFLQAFRDASGRKYGYISYDGPEAIALTQLGETHFDHDLKRNGDKA